MRLYVLGLVIALAGLAPHIACGMQRHTKVLNFSKAVIVVSEHMSPQQHAAVQLLVHEIYRRTKRRLQVATAWPSPSTPVIAVGTVAQLRSYRGPFTFRRLKDKETLHAEGFTIKVQMRGRPAPSVFIIGNDQRGELYGVGYFLRKSRMVPFNGSNHGQLGNLLVPESLAIRTHPVLLLRGIQLGYRPKNNTYDGFTVKMWKNQIRDLVVFGINAVELLPPHTDDIAGSPMFPLPQMDMMVRVDRILKRYGLDVWVWNPMMLKNYASAATVKKGLERDRKLFSSLPKLDAIFVPGGDPGHTSPRVMFNYLAKEARVLHQYHPHAQLWVSPQDFSEQWYRSFFKLLRKQPKWLTGVVYGPGIGMSISQFRRMVPKRYLIRRYPDITHNYDAEFPVPDWDFAYAATENRESINPRPVQEADIFRSASTNDYYGFITYSEGVNDDVNKIIWAELGWNPKASVQTILEDYSRYFIGPKYTYRFAQGLMDLARNWHGGLLDNDSVYGTLQKFRGMQQQASPQVRMNWRFQEALYRAYYDAYERSRLIYSRYLQTKALDILRRAPQIGSLLAMREATKVLNRAVLKPVSRNWKREIEVLAEGLFESIHIQLSVKRYFAKSVSRGANLDLIDYPFDNRGWLERKFRHISALASEKERLQLISNIVNWENPGPGGFYDNLGVPGQEPHLVKGLPYARDPAFLRSAFSGFSVGRRQRSWRVSWQVFGETLYNQPLRMHYSHLDPDAQYVVKVVYPAGDDREMKLVAGRDTVLQPYMKAPVPVHAMEFNIPQEATRGGTLTLTWYPKAGGGCAVAEVWLMRKRFAEDAGRVPVN